MRYPLICCIIPSFCPFLSLSYRLFLKPMTEKDKAGIIETLQANKKVLFFLARFLGMFGGLSIIYAYWISTFDTAPDSFTWWVGDHLKLLLGQNILDLKAIEGYPAIQVIYQGDDTVSLFEGCNGLAVMILFFSFVFAYKGKWMDLLWFVPLGLAIVHLMNLGRLILLIRLAEQNSPFFHFMHKYLFTLVLYAVVFALWFGWIKLVAKRNKS